MSLKPTILLFDIDGTLVDMKGAGRRAMERAFLEVTGRSDVLDFSFAGQTDPLIFVQGLYNAKIPLTRPDLFLLRECYLTALVEEAEKGPAPQIYPGVRALLEQVSGLADVAVGIGTGNVEAGAKVKLKSVNLDSFFSFGGYGSDDGQRAGLVHAGLQRGAAVLGVSLEQCRRVIIGDTERDIQAAHANDAICVAVATGPLSESALEDHGADFVFTDLSDPGVLAALLGS